LVLATQFWVDQEKANGRLIATTLPFFWKVMIVSAGYAWNSGEFSQEIHSDHTPQDKQERTGNIHLTTMPRTAQGVPINYTIF